MSYCAPLGIPHSVFLSWSPDDQDKALAWQRYQATICGHCGTIPADWIGPDGRLRPQDQWPWRISSYNCWGCKLQKDKLKEIGEAGELTDNEHPMWVPNEPEPA